MRLLISNYKVKFRKISRFVFYEISILDATDNSSRLKYSHQGLKASLQCHECIGIINTERLNADPDIYTDEFAQEAQRLLAILNGRIQTFLKEIVKVLKNNLTTKKKVNHDSDGLTFDDFKEMFAISLRLNDTSSTFTGDLFDAITRLKKIYEKHLIE